MSRSRPSRSGVRPNGRRGAPFENDEPTIDAEAVLELLSDDHARCILNELDQGPRSASELVECLDSSRATVYRRLDSLESAGLVRSSISVQATGHHRQRYRIAVDRVRLGFGSDGITLEGSARGDRGCDVVSTVHR